MLGWSKLWGEYYVKEFIKKHFIIRMPLLYNFRELKGQNYIISALERARAGQEVFVSDIQVTNPTWTRHLAEVICDLLSTDNYGIYHVGSTGFTYLPQFISAVLETEGLDPALVKTDDIKAKDNCCPRNSVIQSAALPYMKEVRVIPGWREALNECYNNEWYNN